MPKIERTENGARPESAYGGHISKSEIRNYPSQFVCGLGK
jgi:hypothetical protein